jgi:hypothetical protein
MSEIINATENDNWLLNLIDSNQYKQQKLEQRVQTLELTLKVIIEKLNQIIEMINK